MTSYDIIWTRRSQGTHQIERKIGTTLLWPLRSLKEFHLFSIRFIPRSSSFGLKNKRQLCLALSKFFL